jgi:hypothetical protein
MEDMRPNDSTDTGVHDATLSIVGLKKNRVSDSAAS